MQGIGIGTGTIEVDQIGGIACPTSDGRRRYGKGGSGTQSVSDDRLTDTGCQTGICLKELSATSGCGGREIEQCARGRTGIGGRRRDSRE